MIKPYDQTSALRYAKAWALHRNAKYMDFHRLGGDCTNFASQCLFAGCGIMNYAKKLGWYYIDASHRAPAWSGVHFLHEFLTANKGSGPFGEETDLSALVPGDLIQLGNSDRYYHTLFVLRMAAEDIFIATHTIDSYDRPLSTYQYERVRGIHILGARTNENANG